MPVKVILAGFVAGATAKGHGYVSSLKWLPRQSLSLSSGEVDAADPMPTDFSWRTQNLVTSDWNQHIPEYCGSCWIHGTLSALQDRIKIMRGGKSADVILGRQSVVNCVPDAEDPVNNPPPGCNGGDSFMIHKYMSEHPVPDQSCMPYQAKNMGCRADTVCRNCMPASMEESSVGGCIAIDHFIGYGVSDFGSIKGEAAMMQEIKNRGPIACSFATDDDFMYKYSENALAHDGVFVSATEKTPEDIDHVMEVTGWGQSASGIPYWEVRNSWGTYWGSGGWSKIKRGTLVAEYSCDWGVPEFEQLKAVEAGKIMGDYRHGISPVANNISKPLPVVV